MSSKGKTLAIIGTILQSGPVFGILGTVIGMVRAFVELGKDSEASQEALAQHISFSLYTTAGGLMLSTVGAILLLIALLGLKYRAPWLHVVMWIFSILWLFNIPIGTILGIVVIVCLINHKDEFTETPLNPSEQ